MAGILANSATVTMVSGDTAVDKAIGGFVTGESIALSVTGSPTTVNWELARPADGTTRSDLKRGAGATNQFTPDVAGYYVVTASADGTPYVIRINVLLVTSVSSKGAVHLAPMADSQIPTPAVGITLFCTTSNTLRYKDAAGVFFDVTAT